MSQANTREQDRNPERELEQLFELGRQVVAPSDLWSRIESEARAGLHQHEGPQAGTHLAASRRARPMLSSRMGDLLRVAAAFLGFSLFAAGAWSLEQALEPEAIADAELSTAETVDELNRHLRETVPVLAGRSFPGSRLALFSENPELRLVSALTTHTTGMQREDER